MENEDYERSVEKNSSYKSFIQKTTGVCKAEKNDRRLLRGHITHLIK